MLEENDISGDSIKRLLDTESIQNIKELKFLHYEANAIDHFASGIYLSDYLTNLEVLNINNRGRPINMLSITAITDARLENLKTLNLSKCYLSPDLFITFFVNLKFSSLTSLKLAKSGAIKGNLQLLANNEYIKNLKLLDISHTDLINEDIDALCTSPNFKHVEVLNLESNMIKKEGVESLANSEYLKQLKGLNLSTNKIGKEGVESLANSRYLKQLKVLDLSYNELDNEDISIIAGSSNFQHLQSLNLSFNEMDDQAIKSLSDSQYLKHLTHLDLSENDITSHSIEILANSENIKNLKVLDLSNTSIRSQAIETLSQSPNFKHLHTLTLGLTSVKTAIASLADSPYINNLKILRLCHADIKTDDIKELIRLSNKVSFQDLTIEYTSLAVADVVLLAQDLPEDVKLNLRGEGGLSIFYDELLKLKKFNSASGQVPETEWQQAVTEMVLKIAPHDNDGKIIQYILSNQDSYPLLINARDSDNHSLSYYYNNNGEMLLILFRNGLIPDPVQDDTMQRIVEDAQSVHDSEITNKTNFFVKKLVQLANLNTEELKAKAQICQSQINQLFVQSMELKVKLLDLTAQEKRSVMETILRNGEAVPEDSYFVQKIINKAFHTLKNQYLTPAYEISKLQYDYTAGQEKYITLPETIGVVHTLIDKSGPDKITMHVLLRRVLKLLKARQRFNLHF
ncbi:Leucine-rich repeat (LRR) protein [Rickettsiales bacterium Ac37b]|nr:Leucine-rich repeat (LRR) protein [Rickettsiales bacterium Ac37b]